MSGQDNACEGMPPLTFQSFVLMLTITGMQQLGKTDNSKSCLTGTDLFHAKQTIDLLEILELKTHGNLTKEEEDSLKSSLTNLRMTYTEAVNKND